MKRAGQAPRLNTYYQIRNPKSEIRNAFTLVELLVVISIIVTLATLAVAVPYVHAGSAIAYLLARHRPVCRRRCQRPRYKHMRKKPRRAPLSAISPIRISSPAFAYSAPMVSQTAGNLAGQPPQNTVAVTRPGLPSNSATD